MSKKSLATDHSYLLMTKDAFIPRSIKALLLLMVKPYRKKACAFFGLTFLGVLAYTATPVVIAKLITHLSRTRMIDATVWKLVAAYILLRILDEVLWRAAELVMRSFKPQMIESVRTNLFAATLKKPYSFFVNSSSGRIGHWINQTTNTTNEFVDTTLWTTWGLSIGLVISAFFLFTVHWSLAVLFIVWLVTLFWFNTQRGKKFSKLVARQSNENSIAASMVVDSVSNHLSVRVFNAQNREQRMLARQQALIISSWRTSWWQNWITNAVKGQSAAVVSIAALALVVTLYSHGVVQLGGIVLFVAYFGDASTSLWQLAWALDSYFRNFGTIQNALDGLNSTNERTISSAKNKLVIPRTVALELRDISFAYPEQLDRLILSSLNLTIAAGEKVGIVGHSGAGKSTLIGLLLGFYEPTNGDIYVNGQAAVDKDPSFVRSVSSFVPQDTSLFNRNVRDNVLYARPSANETDLTAALKQAQAYDFVQKLPKGIETEIGERGIKLSGGQRQRLAIARAILQNAPLLLLDEATSALDSVSEQAIQKALHSLMQDRTTIVIAHRLSTLRHLDRIVVLNNGTIAEQGSHDALLSQNGIYADLWKRQKDGFLVD